jgi:hypothetical protein
VKEEWALEEISHKAVIAGYITDSITGQAIANAVVEVMEEDLHTLSHNDGFFYFLDLLPGQYRLRVSAPHLGSRYGVIGAVDITVESSNGKPIFDLDGHVKLPPTRLTGIVIRMGEENTPIENARLQILGSDIQTSTDNQGRYGLSGLVKGNPTVWAFAEGFVTSSQSVTLVAGEEATADFSLASIPPD